MIGRLALCGTAAYSQQYPQVAGLKPFTAETNYMSLPGYLRWAHCREFVLEQPVPNGWGGIFAHDLNGDRRTARGESASFRFRASPSR